MDENFDTLEWKRYFDGKSPEQIAQIKKLAGGKKQGNAKCPKSGLAIPKTEVLDESQENPNSIFMIVSFFLPIVGFILSLVYFTRYGVENRKTAKICMGWAVAGLFTALLLWIAICSS